MKTIQHFFVAIGLIFFSLCIPLTFVKAIDCVTAQSGNVTLTESCTFGGTYDGAADGNIVVGTNVTLTVLAGQIVNVSQGYNYTITASGAKIVIVDSGLIQISTSTICLTDADGDTYAASLNPSTQTLATGLCGTGKISRKDAMTQADCNDANASYFAALTCYADADGDTYYSKTSGSVCAGATCAGVGQSATIGTDCCDTDANAKPGQASFFAVARTGCGGFDYNCDSVETRGIGAGGEYGTCVANTSTQSCDMVGGNSGFISDPGCGNVGSYRLGGCCNPSGDCSGTAYPACGLGNAATSNLTQTCR